MNTHSRVRTALHLESLTRYATPGRIRYCRGDRSKRKTVNFANVKTEQPSLSRRLCLHVSTVCLFTKAIAAAVQVYFVYKT